MQEMNQRQSRVAEEVRHIAAAALLRGEVPSSVPLSRVTVTGAWVSADLRLARLYVAFPDGTDVPTALEALNRQVSGPLRKVLAKQLATKYIPEVSFIASENGL